MFFMSLHDPLKRIRNLGSLCLALGTTLGLAACSSDHPTEPRPTPKGALQVGVTTGGTATDPDGYSLTLAPGGASEMIGANDIAQVAFVVTCTAVVATGSIEIAIVTTGSLPPDDYMVVLNGSTTATAPVGATLPDTARVSFTNVPIGAHQVEITGIPGGCSLTPPTPPTWTSPQTQRPRSNSRQAARWAKCPTISFSSAPIRTQTSRTSGP